MEIINGHESVLNLNPRQIYLIKRVQTKRIVDSLQSFIDSFDEFDLMQFHIVDLTAQDDLPEQQSQLYKDFIDEGGPHGPWDIIVRNFTGSMEDQSFSVWHFRNNIEENKVQLEVLKEQMEDLFWGKIVFMFDMSVICGTSYTIGDAKFKAFLKRLMMAKNADFSASSINSFVKAYLRASRREHSQMVRDLIGKRFDLVDEYIGFIPWNSSDCMMDNFMKTGCSISYYGIDIIRNKYPTGSTKDNHANYLIKIKAADGKEYYPHFSGALNFSFYIMLLKRQGISLSRGSFDFTSADARSASNLCNRITAILATIKGYSLYLSKDEDKFCDCISAIKKFAMMKKDWQNGSAIRPSLEPTLGSANTDNFIAENRTKGEKWVEVPKEQIRFDKQFDDEYNKNHVYIASRNPFMRDTVSCKDLMPE